jgi:AcrR family transcriptional regulator
MADATTSASSLAPPATASAAQPSRPADCGATGSAVPSERSTRKAETQDRIVAGALALFAERGYDGTSISAVAARAHVSRAAVFWHFGDKAGLFRETFRRMLVPFFGELQASLEHIPPRQRVLEILGAYERVVEENEGAIRSIVRWLFESERLREALLETLFSLHDALITDLADTLRQAGAGAGDSRANAAALVALLDGNLLLALLDPSAHNRDLRREGLRQLARAAMGSDDG